MAAATTTLVVSSLPGCWTLMLVTRHLLFGVAPDHLWGDCQLQVWVAAGRRCCCECDLDFRDLLNWEKGKGGARAKHRSKKLAQRSDRTWCGRLNLDVHGQQLRRPSWGRTAALYEHRISCSWVMVRCQHGLPAVLQILALYSLHLSSATRQPTQSSLL